MVTRFLLFLADDTAYGVIEIVVSLSRLCWRRCVHVRVVVGVVVLIKEKMTFLKSLLVFVTDDFEEIFVLLNANPL